uniref:Putative secreted protein n=1 Tax=Anopheles triannulatus TaxID=58253 RepID=A0A2M4B5H6_9DIPT
MSRFLWNAMISSLRMAFRIVVSLKLGCMKQRAVATAEAVRGPATPTDEINSAMLGVRRNGTGRFTSNSPVLSSISNRKYETFIRPESWCR